MRVNPPHHSIIFANRGAGCPHPAPSLHASPYRARASRRHPLPVGEGIRSLFEVSDDLVPYLKCGSDTVAEL
jgi:hypothetical protein